MLRAQEPNLSKKFATHYDELLEAHPDAGVAIGRIVEMRSDLKKNQRKALLEQLKVPHAASTQGDEPGSLFATLRARHPACFSG